ncbi:MAG TPA: methionine adenosyltransferase [Candidatus Bathyarchaeia archaeon]|nr:methionine adenosyltransferase [Candidatus Bathyarchaeia archaeon]
MSLIIEALGGRPVAERRMEVVERKGVGHPDTICDSVVEAASIALSRMYLERAGVVAHYNVDKALLIAGQCIKRFGSGEMTGPMELIIGDRATSILNGHELPVAETVRQAVEAWLEASLPGVRPGKDLVTRVALAPGSEELRRVYTQGENEIPSNDTSGASGYAPLTPTEELVLEVERYLNSPHFKTEFPDTGQDVKVMGVREDDRLAVTVAMPLACLLTRSEASYFARKEEVLHALSTRFASAPFVVDWQLNRLDRRGWSTAGVYLTLTGTSAEDADSGQVGRGNRANGLIAFSRPTGGEATAGKNPAAHAGKIYSVLSHRLARLVHARCPALREVYVHMAVRIGEPVDRPWTGVQLSLPGGVALGDVEQEIREVVDAELARLPVFRAELIRGEYPVC